MTTSYLVLAAAIVLMASCAHGLDQYYFNYQILMDKTADYLVFMNTTSMDVQYGCGGSNQKCSCEGFQLGQRGSYFSTYTMQGIGTTGVMDGLEFACNTMVWFKNVHTNETTKGCDCRFKIDMDLFWAKNTWESSCDCLGKFKSPSLGGSRQLTMNDRVTKK